MNFDTLSQTVPILLVDDRPENLIVLEGLLSDQGYELIKALSGNEALHMALKQDFALVLLDVLMPVMDGFETAELLRANPKTRHIPIIFVTAVMKDSQFKGYDVGAIDYLMKPIEPLILRSKVRIFAELFQQRRELEMHRQHLAEMVDRRTAELQQAYAELQNSNEQLVKRDKEKGVLLKEIHHRVKNNMQVISSLLNLQAKCITDQTVRAMFEESRNRISSMALIHEKLYHSADLASVDFKEYLRSLVAGVATTYRRRDVVLSINMEPVALDVHSAIPCGLIVNELVSNSLKHAFPAGRQGAITIGLTRNSAGNYLLTVTDNGIGFPADQDFRNSQSLGLQLVIMLTEQLHGTVKLLSDQTRVEGSRFTVTFPGASAKKGDRNG